MGVGYLLLSTTWGKALSLDLLTKKMIVGLSPVPVVLIGPFWFVRLLHKRRNAALRLEYRREVCSGCGYPVGTEGRCPECGKDYTRRSLATRLSEGFNHPALGVDQSSFDATERRSALYPAQYQLLYRSASHNPSEIKATAVNIRNSEYFAPRTPSKI